MRLRVGTLLMACVMFSGCYTLRQRPALPLTVQLYAATDFQVLPPAGAAGQAGSCIIRRAEFDVSGLVGDTLHFSAMRLQRQPAGAPPCSHSGPGRVVLTDYPELRSMQRRMHDGLTWAAVLGTAAAVVLASWVIMFPLSL